jgi:hypothetical protein
MDEITPWGRIVLCVVFAALVSAYAPEYAGSRELVFGSLTLGGLMGYLLGQASHKSREVL